MTVLGLLESSILKLAPKFLRGPNIGRFLKSYAAMQDGNVEALRQGMTLSNPLVCPAEGLPAISKDRTIKIPPSMPEEGVRDMLAHWFQLHRFRGQHQGVLRYLRFYF